MDYEMEELIPLVKELCDRYTGKESTSVTYEAAQQLMEAVLYCIHETAGDVDAAGVSDGRRTARMAYEYGYELAVRKVGQARELYNRMAEIFRSYGNKAYEETFRHGIPAFFLWYDVRLKPQDHIITMDYPVMKNLEGLCGIDAIWEYLRCLEAEQTFLARFPEDYIRQVNVARCADYEEYYINPCRVMLRHVLCCMLADIPADKIRFGEEDYMRLKEEVQSQDREGLKRKLTCLLHVLVKQKYCGDEKLSGYLEYDMADLAFELQNAASHGCLPAVV